MNKHNTYYEMRNKYGIQMSVIFSSLLNNLLDSTSFSVQKYTTDNYVANSVYFNPHLGLIGRLSSSGIIVYVKENLVFLQCLYFST
jgi:hypothetical protein